MPMTYYLWAVLVVLLLERGRPFTAARRQNKGCPKRCGDVMIEYPFVIGPNCSYDGNFTVTCNASSPNPKPFLSSLNLELLEATDRDLTVNNPIVNPCNAANYNNRGTPNETMWSSPDLSGSAFSFETFGNMLFSLGCRGMATLRNETGALIGSCSSNCDQIMDGCNGYLCCQSPINYEDNLTKYSIIVSAIPGSCRLAFISTANFVDAINVTDPAAIAHILFVPVVLTFWSSSGYGHDMNVWSIILQDSIYINPAVGTLLLSCCCFWSCWFFKTKKRRKETRLRAKYFKGRLKQTSSDKEVIEKTKLFTISELKKATDNFNANRMLRQGGQGTVYKGMLTNGQVIAVKKPKTFEEQEWKQFINEVILLSQMNHKNVVKLLGCCLETKLPLLAYEYVSNGTLRQHINDSAKECLLSWEMRVRIATEVAGAIAYLHSLATCVQGTFGYLDPEYFRSSRFSEKSDVYSFGVILVELLTGQQPIRVTDLDEEKSLVLYFITAMKKASLDEILDPSVLKESTTEEIMVMSNLAQQCLKSRGIEMPTMKEVAMELESLMKKSSKITSLGTENYETVPTIELGNGYTDTGVDMHIKASITHYNMGKLTKILPQI